MKIPNILTVFRIFLTFIFIYLLYQNTYRATLQATLVFTIASLTDFFDGYLARKRNAITNFGKIMDPIADKFLLLSAFYIFAQMEIFPFWMFFIIAFREILITGLRLFAVKRGTILAAEKEGKSKTIFQIAAISIILLYLIVSNLEATYAWVANALALFFPLIFGLMAIVIYLTLYSGATFLWNNREHFHV